jgi:hypothetical protein
MVIVKITGGLGNQMFQYALGRAISIRRNEELVLDTMSYIKDKKRGFELDNYNVNYKSKNPFRGIIYDFIYKALNKQPIYRPKSILSEKKTFQFDKDVLSENAKYLVGYWQNPEYFDNIRRFLLKEFEYNGHISELQQNMIKKIKSENSVAIHIRRGDYLETNNKSIYESMDLAYYMKAIEYLKREHNNLTFYFFSDDIDWCKENFCLDDKVTFVDSSISSSQHIDMLLMKSCNHFVIANSTFSWWAAWLSDNNGKIVIAPKNWYRDIEKNSSAKELLLNDWVII